MMVRFFIAKFLSFFSEKQKIIGCCSTVYRKVTALLHTHTWEKGFPCTLPASITGTRRLGVPSSCVLLICSPGRWVPGSDKADLSCQVRVSRQGFQL